MQRDANRTTLKARQYVGMVATPGGGHRCHPEDRLAERPGALLIDLQSTLNAFQPERFQCPFDEFTVDTPLNRVLKDRHIHVPSVDLLDQESHALFQARLDEAIQVAVQHALGVADFVVGAQILDA